jgi:probable HAF family extracellular repeat protein
MRTAHDFGDAMSPGVGGRFVVRRLFVLACLVAGFVAFMPGGAGAASLFTATDLGTLPGGNRSGADGVNASGQIVGSSGTASGNNHAFSYTPSGGMVDLGTLFYSPSSFATGVSASGQIVGYGVDFNAGGIAHAFSYTPSGGMVDLGTLPGDISSTADAVNDSGQIVGSSVGLGGPQHAFSYAPSGEMVDLGTLPGGRNSQANGVSASGQIVGWSGTASGIEHAFSYTPTGGMVDLGTLPDSSDSFAYGVNDSGQIVGFSGTPSGIEHAFSYTPSGGMVDLGTLPGGSDSFAYGVNDSGKIVGAGDTASGQYLHAVLWQVSEQPTTTSVGCKPGFVSVGNATACSVSVSDTGTGVGVTPGGSVRFSSDGSGSFSGSGSCTLSSGSCQVIYTPSAVRTGSHKITASYGGDSSHAASEASTTVTVTTRSTSTAVSCSSSQFAPGDATTCMATVSDTDTGTSTTPAGTASFSSSGPGSFGGNPCTLSLSSPRVASCQVTFTSLSLEAKTITASYGGDATHEQGAASTSVTVALPTSTNGCQIQGEGLIIAANADRASFALDVRAPSNSRHDGDRGWRVVSYRDFGPVRPFQLLSRDLQALTCAPGRPSSGSMFGTGKVDRSSTVFFRIDVIARPNTDNHHSSRRHESSYRIRLSNGYDSGLGPLHAGQIKISIHNQNDNGHRR